MGKKKAKPAARKQSQLTVAKPKKPEALPDAQVRAYIASEVMRKVGDPHISIPPEFSERIFRILSKASSDVAASLKEYDGPLGIFGFGGSEFGPLADPLLRSDLVLRQKASDAIHNRSPASNRRVLEAYLANVFSLACQSHVDSIMVDQFGAESDNEFETDSDSDGDIDPTGMYG